MSAERPLARIAAREANHRLALRARVGDEKDVWRRLARPRRPRARSRAAQAVRGLRRSRSPASSAHPTGFDEAAVAAAAADGRVRSLVRADETRRSSACSSRGRGRGSGSPCTARRARRDAASPRRSARGASQSDLLRSSGPARAACIAGVLHVEDLERLNRVCGARPRRGPPRASSHVFSRST